MSVEVAESKAPALIKWHAMRIKNNYKIKTFCFFQPAFESKTIAFQVNRKRNGKREDLYCRFSQDVVLQGEERTGFKVVTYSL